MKHKFDKINKREGPFKVGDLVRHTGVDIEGSPHSGIFLVLELKHFQGPPRWTVFALSQQTGKKQWYVASVWRHAGVSDE